MVVLPFGFFSVFSAEFFKWDVIRDRTSSVRDGTFSGVKSSVLIHGKTVTVIVPETIYTEINCKFSLFINKTNNYLNTPIKIIILIKIIKPNKKICINDSKLSHS